MKLSMLILLLITATLSTVALGQLSQEAQIITSNEIIVLKNSAGAELHILRSGAVVQKLLVPDANGTLGDVALGFDSVDPYLNGTSPYFGAGIGRVANRIAGGNFTFQGTNYSITLNDGQYNNALHGGVIGWNKHQWRIISQNQTSVKLYVLSPDGDQGFGGNVNATVQYTLNDPATVDVVFTAESDAASPINMAQHTYFNLNGIDTASTILNHQLQINSTHITPVNDNLIPTGEFTSIAGTPNDFPTLVTLGDVIHNVTGPASDPGIDTNYVLWGWNGTQAFQNTKNCVALAQPALAATVHSPLTGRTLQLYTNTPGLQVYTSGQLSGAFKGKHGVAYPQFAAVVLETQVFPNFVNQPNFPQCVVGPNQPYSTQVTWVFSASNSTKATNG